ncbi:MAG: thioredoxin family protein [Actinobacteria bacterium]|nr:MAG: thioredoxin family protein [Actinomycetota bacterium]
MKVTLLYFDDCPNWKVADGHLQALSSEIDGLEVSRIEVTTPEDAERHQFRGSPSVLIEGHDPFAEATDPVGLSCRVYQTPDGPAGSPTLSQLRQVLT